MHLRQDLQAKHHMRYQEGLVLIAANQQASTSKHPQARRGDLQDSLISRRVTQKWNVFTLHEAQVYLG